MNKIEIMHNTIEDYLNSSLNKVIKYYGASKVGGEDYRAKQIHDIIVEVISKVSQIFIKYPSASMNIFEGEFTSVSDQKLPLFAILDMLNVFYQKVSSLCPLTKEQEQLFKMLIIKARSLNFSREFKPNWHINPTIAECTDYNPEYKFRNATKNAIYIPETGNTIKYKSTIRTLNGLIYDGIDSLTPLSTLDEEVLNYDTKQYPELVCSDVTVVDITSTRYDDEKSEGIEKTSRVVLFSEQLDTLRDKYHSLEASVRKAKAQVLHNNFITYVLPLFEDQTLKEFQLAIGLNWNESYLMKCLRDSLENVYYTINSYAKSVGDSPTTVLSDSDLLFLIEDQINWFTKYVSTLKRNKIYSIVCIYNSIPPTKRSFYGYNISGENLAKRLMRLPIRSICECESNMRNHKYSLFTLGRYI